MLVHHKSLQALLKIFSISFSFTLAVWAMTQVSHLSIKSQRLKYDLPWVVKVCPMGRQEFEGFSEMLLMMFILAKVTVTQNVI